MESLYKSLKNGLEEKKSENIKIEVKKKRNKSINIAIRDMNEIEISFTVSKEKGEIFVSFWASENKKSMKFMDILGIKKSIIFYYEMIKKQIEYYLKEEPEFKLQYLLGEKGLIRESDTLKTIMELSKRNLKKKGC